MSKRKYSATEKIRFVEQYLDGTGSQKGIARELGISKASFQQWIRNYKSMGADVFTRNSYKKYSAELKIMAVEEYLRGVGSRNDICLKYGIRATSKLAKWIIQYNNHEELTPSPAKGEIIMAKSRATEFDERIEIVKYCIENNFHYAEAAEKYQVSYQQVYQWVKKYESKGVEGLLDKRGKRKPEGEMSEVEKLRTENKLLEAKNRRAEMEIELLKKLEELERRRY